MVTTRLAALQRQQRVDVIGHAPGEALQQIATEAQNDARLRAVEADGIDQLRDASGRQAQHRRRRVGHREQPCRGRPGRGVLRPQREDAGDEHAERIAVLLGDEGERRAVPARLRPPQAADDVRDV